MERTVELLTLLYELSLTNIKHQKPEDAARKFVKKLLARKSLKYGAVWKIEGKRNNLIQMKCFYSMPELTANGTMDHSLYSEVFQHENVAFLNRGLITEINFPGNYIYFKMDDFGLLELYDDGSNPSFKMQSFYPLKDVVIQLGINLERGLAYESLQDEIKWRKRAEKSLKSNEEKYQRIIDNIKLGLMEVDNNEIIQYANKPFLDLTGYSLKEIVGKNASDIFLVPADQHSKDTINKKNELRKKGKADSYEIKILDKEGNEKWLIIGGAPNYDQVGNLIGSIGIHMDITEEKLLKEENEFKSTQLKKLFEKALDALITIDQEGKVFEWSPQAEKIFGYSESEIKGKKISESIIPQNFRSAHETGMKHYLATGHGPVLNSRIEITAIKKSGEEFPIELTIFPLKFKEQHYFTAFVRDITEIKKSKENMEKALERQKELNEMKSQFISMTSHELRTPLTTIRSNTELINYQIDNNDVLRIDQLKKNAQRIDNNVDRLNQLINNILMIGKLDSQKVPFSPTPIIVDAFIKENILPDFSTKGSNIICFVKGDPFPINLDKNLFTQILMNLIENAVKYSPDAKSPQVHVHYKEDLIIKVIDFGIGIPEKDQPKLFSKFFRASNVRNIQGTGLGLAIVKDFIKLHDGELSVDSEEGKGSTFIIKFPRK
jgi:PAS domain S-box-containing protein